LRPWTEIADAAGDIGKTGYLRNDSGVKKGPVVGQFEFLRELCGLSLAAFVLEAFATLLAKIKIF
jgi:hypothetical protein